ncbi:MAG: Holliday junction resolvase RuvX [Actinomycetes bacterium]
MLAGRRIAFDFGLVRIGVAISDYSGMLASPLVTLKAQDQNLSNELSQIFAEHEPIYIVVGDPKHMSGEVSEKSREARTFAELLGSLTATPIFLIDERLTTVSALRALQDSGVNAKAARRRVDEAAAVAILESALSEERLSGSVGGVAL